MTLEQMLAQLAQFHKPQIAVRLSYGEWSATLECSDGGNTIALRQSGSGPYEVVSKLLASAKAIRGAGIEVMSAPALEHHSEEL